MGKIKSSLKAYFINTGTAASPVWASLGKGISKFPLSYKPEKTTETYIDEDNATTSIDSYAVSAGLDISLWDSVSAPAHAYLEEIRKTRAVGANAESQILEVDLNTSSPYNAQLSDCVISVTSLNIEGGKPQTLGVDVDYNGDPTNGTVVITDGAPVFSASSASALTATTSPVDDASDVSASANIVITFSNKIRAESIVLMSAAGAVVAVARSWNAGGTILTLNPTSNLSTGVTYLLTLAGVVDIYGQALTAAVNNFTVA